MNKKATTYENYPFWDAYAAVKNGEWTSEEFHLWASTVWNDGADSVEAMAKAHEELDR